MYSPESVSDYLHQRDTGDGTLSAYDAEWNAVDPNIKKNIMPRIIDSGSDGEAGFQPKNPDSEDYLSGVEEIEAAVGANGYVPSSVFCRSDEINDDLENYCMMHRMRYTRNGDADILRCRCLECGAVFTVTGSVTDGQVWGSGCGCTGSDAVVENVLSGRFAGIPSEELALLNAHITEVREGKRMPGTELEGIGDAVKELAESHYGQVLEHSADMYIVKFNDRVDHFDEGSGDTEAIDAIISEFEAFPTDLQDRMGCRDALYQKREKAQSRVKLHDIEKEMPFEELPNSLEGLGTMSQYLRTCKGMSPEDQRAIAEYTGRLDQKMSYTIGVIAKDFQDRLGALDIKDREGFEAESERLGREYDTACKIPEFMERAEEYGVGALNEDLKSLRDLSDIVEMIQEFGRAIDEDRTEDVIKRTSELEEKRRNLKTSDYNRFEEEYGAERKRIMEKCYGTLVEPVLKILERDVGTVEQLQALVSDYEALEPERREKAEEYYPGRLSAVLNDAYHRILDSMIRSLSPSEVPMEEVSRVIDGLSATEAVLAPYKIAGGKEADRLRELIRAHRSRNMEVALRAVSSSIDIYGAADTPWETVLAKSDYIREAVRGMDQDELVEFNTRGYLERLRSAEAEITVKRIGGYIAEYDREHAVKMNDQAFLGDAYAVWQVAESMTEGASRSRLVSLGYPRRLREIVDRANTVLYGKQAAELIARIEAIDPASDGAADALVSLRNETMATADGRMLDVYESHGIPTILAVRLQNAMEMHRDARVRAIEAAIESLGQGAMSPEKIETIKLIDSQIGELDDTGRIMLLGSGDHAVMLEKARTAAAGTELEAECIRFMERLTSDSIPEYELIDSMDSMESLIRKTGADAENAAAANLLKVIGERRAGMETRNGLGLRYMYLHREYTDLAEADPTEENIARAKLLATELNMSDSRTLELARENDLDARIQRLPSELARRNRDDLIAGISRDASEILSDDMSRSAESMDIRVSMLDDLIDRLVAADPEYDGALLHNLENRRRTYSSTADWIRRGEKYLDMSALDVASVREAEDLRDEGKEVLTCSEKNEILSKVGALLNDYYGPEKAVVEDLKTRLRMAESNPDAVGPLVAQYGAVRNGLSRRAEEELRTEGLTEERVKALSETRSARGAQRFEKALDLFDRTRNLSLIPGLDTEIRFMDSEAREYAEASGKIQKYEALKENAYTRQAEILCEDIRMMQTSKKDKGRYSGDIKAKYNELMGIPPVYRSKLEPIVEMIENNMAKES